MRASVFCLLSSVFCICGIAAGERSLEDMGAAPSYDEVVYGLIGNLGRDSAAAQDAAFKLARLGKRAVPALAEVLKANLVATPSAGTPPPEAKAKQQLAYYAVLALSHIKAHEAARLLLPLLSNEKADPELRVLAVEAYGLEVREGRGTEARDVALPEALPVLQKVASGDPDINMRKKAFAQISLLSTFWIQSEKLVVNALSDPDDEIRALAAKQCWYARIYLSAADKLVEMAEKDTSSAARSFALLALSRMKVTKAVPAVVRICLRPELTAVEQKQAFNVLSELTGLSPKDPAAVRAWWEKAGKAEYGKFEAPALTPAVPTAPDTPAPDKKPNP